MAASKREILSSAYDIRICSKRFAVDFFSWVVGFIAIFLCPLRIKALKNSQDGMSRAAKLSDIVRLQHYPSHTRDFH